VLSHTGSPVDNLAPARRQSFVFLHTKLRVITHRLSCYHTPKWLVEGLFLFQNQRLAETPFSRNSLLTGLTSSEAVENAPPLGYTTSAPAKAGKSCPRGNCVPPCLAPASPAQRTRPPLWACGPPIRLTAVGSPCFSSRSESEFPRWADAQCSAPPSLASSCKRVS
jgi:hypothetical protein